LPIEEAAKRGRTNAALSVIDGQRKARQALAGERQREASSFGQSEGTARRLRSQGPANRD
jgi:hypothetical protein